MRRMNLNGRMRKLIAEREREIRKARARGETLKAIGDKHGISRERVRQILAAK